MAEQPPLADRELSGVGTRAPLPPAPRRLVPAWWWVLALSMLVLAAGSWWLRRGAEPPAAPAAAPVAVGPAPPQAEAPPAMQPAAPASVATVPPEPQVAEGALDAAGVAAALAALAGEPALRSLLIGDDFVQRFVVTVDNLAREHAPVRLWPVQPTPGRYQVIERDGRLYADPDNAARYTPLVLLAERLDARAVVALYARLLPLLQPAYEDLGYPGRRFHDRLVAVVDHLLAAPQAPELLPLRLVEVKGDVPSLQPWLRYEFADDALQSASAGHKILLRVGAVNERRLKAVLRAWRAELERQPQR